MTGQALFFDAAIWTRGESADWCAEHDFEPIDWRSREDENGVVTHHIAVLRRADEFDPDSFKTISNDFPEGISMTVGQPKSATRNLQAVEVKYGEQSQEDPLEFVLSDNSVDRMGDIIEQDGWQLSDFRRNPIALFGHDHKAVLGTWEKVRRDGSRLVGRLKLAAPGTSQLVDEVRSLLEQRVLRAVSVGFRPIEHEEIKDKQGNWTGGFRFLRNALHEVSVVSVPANANALAIAKGMKLSAETRRLVCGESAASRVEPDANPKTIIARSRKMDKNEAGAEAGAEVLPTQIKNAEKDLTKTEVELDALKADVLEADGDMTDDQEQRLDELEAEHARLTKRIGNLKRLEQAKAAGSAPPAPVTRGEAPGVIRGAAPAPGMKKGDLFVRWLAVNFLATGKGIRFDHAAEKLFGKAQTDKTVLRRVMDFETRVSGDAVERAAVDPAMTNVPGWLGELVGSEMQGFIENLSPDALLPKLLARSSVARATFGPGVGAVTIPIEGDVSRPIGAAPGTPEHVAGEFFAEGAPIRVARFTIEEMMLAAKETGVIVPWTRKLEQYSAIELVGFIERVVRRHTARRLDDILLSATAMDDVNPQGLADPAIAGFTSTAFTPATPGSPTVQEVEDAVGGLIDALGPNAIDPVLIVPQMAANKLGRYRTATGPKAFSDDLASGEWMGADILLHDTGPTNEVYALDAGRFVIAYGAPDFDLSSEATLHMENTSPAQIVDSGVAADPTRSLYQTASRAVRMILDASWMVGGSGRSHQLTGFNV